MRRNLAVLETAKQHLIQQVQDVWCDNTTPKI